MRERERERERIERIERIERNYKTILEKLEESRKTTTISRFELATYLGLTENGYFKVLKGQTKLDVERLLLILKKLNVSPEEFFKDFNE